MTPLTEEEKKVMKSVFQNLTDEQRSHIMSFFDKGESCTIEYAPGKFLACNLGEETPSFTVKIRTEFWCLGE